MVKVITWNIGERKDAWHCLLESGADIALVQEATEPPADVAQRIKCSPGPWRTAGAGRRPGRAVVVQLSSRVDVKWITPTLIEDARSGELVVSRPGTLDAASVTPPTGEPFVAISMYAQWENPRRGSWIYADASVHRLISDLSVFVSRQSGDRILAAGDLNILYRYGEHGSLYWARRYKTVFDRMQALGLCFVGPQAPEGGRKADPRPAELPPTSRNVPTFRTNSQTPATATRQLDFVFASTGLAKRCRVRALNEPQDWGPSDHCRVKINVG